MDADCWQRRKRAEEMHLLCYPQGNSLYPKEVLVELLPRVSGKWEGCRFAAISQPEEQHGAQSSLKLNASSADIAKSLSLDLEMADFCRWHHSLAGYKAACYLQMLAILLPNVSISPCSTWLRAARWRSEFCTSSTNKLRKEGFRQKPRGELILQVILLSGWVRGTSMRRW